MIPGHVKIPVVLLCPNNRRFVARLTVFVIVKTSLAGFLPGSRRKGLIQAGHHAGNTCDLETGHVWVEEGWVKRGQHKSNMSGW